MSSHVAFATLAESLTGPSIDLDDDIHQLFNPGPSRLQRPSDRRAASPFRYTASIDAAKMLVPEGMDWSVGTQPDLGDRKRAWGNTSPSSVMYCAEGEITCEAATPALALCAAALRAHATKLKEAAHV